MVRPFPSLACHRCDAASSPLDTDPANPNPNQNPTQHYRGSAAPGSSTRPTRSTSTWCTARSGTPRPTTRRPRNTSSSPRGWVHGWIDGGWGGGTGVGRSRLTARTYQPHCHHYRPIQCRQRGNAAARASVGDRQAWTEGGEQAAGGEERPQWRDHVNTLGLPNDGYDYGRHLKRMGGWCMSMDDNVILYANVSDGSE